MKMPKDSKEVKDLRLKTITVYGQQVRVWPPALAKKIKKRYVAERESEFKLMRNQIQHSFYHHYTLGGRTLQYSWSK